VFAFAAIAMKDQRSTQYANAFGSVPVVLLLAITSSCQSSVSQSPRPLPSVTVSYDAGGCTSSAVLPSPTDPARSSPPEVHAASSGGELWVMAYRAHPSQQLHPGDELKTIMRMTGSGDLVLNSTNGRTRVGPTRGPDQHGGSNWERPGDEWGAIWSFPEAGCWQVHAQRTAVSGDFWVVVTD
jgi:hypothetical protein